MDHPAVRVGSPMPTPPKSRKNSTYEDLLAAFDTQRSPSSVTRARRSAAKPAEPAGEALTSLAPAKRRRLSPSPDPLSIDPSSPDPLAADQPLASPTAMALSQSSGAGFSEDTLSVAQAMDDTPRRSLRKRAQPEDFTYAIRPKPKFRTNKQSRRILLSDMVSGNSPVVTRKSATARMQVRTDIAHTTKTKQDAFLAHYKRLFTPLLPHSNYVTKLGRHASGDFVPYVELDQQPEGVVATLKPYQLQGLSFLSHMNENGMPCLLGDEMGLGKTLQTLSLFQLLEERRQTRSVENQPYLIVCPLSVVNSWVSEARRWTPDLNVLRFHGPKAERDHLKKVATGHQDRYGNETARSKNRTGDRRRASNKLRFDFNSDDEEDNFKIVVTSYETFVAEQSWFKTAFVWRYIVLDEGHRVKNSASQVSQALQTLRAEYRLILTGTPLQNDLLEMWSLLHWLLPDVFTGKTAELFKSSFDLSKGKVNTSVMDNARQLLELLMLRRMKDSPGVDLGLPPKEEVLLYVPLTPLQRFWYLRLLTRSGDALLDDIFSGVKVKEEDALRQDLKDSQEIKALEAAESKLSAGQTDVWSETRQIMKQNLEIEQKEKKNDWQRLMNLIMQLRKCCSHPYLLPNVEPSPYVLGDHVIRASGKFIVLEKLLQELILNRRKKVLLFSGFKATLDLCEDLLAMIGGRGDSFRYLRFDGSTERARRNLDIRLFNDKSSDYMAMLISTRAGGLGINLTAATEAIFLDEDWNPQITLQAEARAHRIGQSNPVTIYKLCTQGTVEEQMMGRIRKKLYLSAKITESMKSIHGTSKPTKKSRASNDDDQPQLNTSQLKTLVRRGAQTLAHPELDVTEMLDWNFATMIEKCRDRPSDPHVNEEHNVDEQKWLSSMERVETAVLDGRRIQRKLMDDEKVEQNLSRTDRRIGKNTTVMIDGFAVNKQSMGCGDWEAVPTLAGKDPRLAEPERPKKKAIINQDHCQVCWDGGELWVCCLCPRSYHKDCLTVAQQSAVRMKTQFTCPQHACADCSKKTSEVGGMLFRCRFCEAAYCEDCLDFERTTLIGGSLPEFEVLGFGEVRQAFFVRCHNCADLHDKEPEMKEFCEAQTKLAEEAFQELQAQEAAEAQLEEESAAAAKRLSGALKLENNTVFPDADAPTDNSIFPDEEEHTNHSGGYCSASAYSSDSDGPQRRSSTRSKPPTSVRPRRAANRMANGNYYDIPPLPEPDLLDDSNISRESSRSLGLSVDLTDATTLGGSSTNGLSTPRDFAPLSNTNTFFPAQTFGLGSGGRKRAANQTATPTLSPLRADSLNRRVTRGLSASVAADAMTPTTRSKKRNSSGQLISPSVSMDNPNGSAADAVAAKRRRSNRLSTSFSIDDWEV